MRPTADVMNINGPVSVAECYLKLVLAVLKSCVVLLNMEIQWLESCFTILRYMHHWFCNLLLPSTYSKWSMIHKRNLCQSFSRWINIRKKIRVDNRLEPWNGRSCAQVCTVHFLLIILIVAMWIFYFLGYSIPPCADNWYILRHSGPRNYPGLSQCTFPDVNKQMKKFMLAFF